MNSPPQNGGRGGGAVRVYRGSGRNYVVSTQCSRDDLLMAVMKGLAKPSDRRNFLTEMLVMTSEHHRAISARLTEERKMGFY